MLPAESRFVAGDHLKVRRPFGYWHHGIYVGGDRVIEFGGEKKSKEAAQVREVALVEFQDGGLIEVVGHERPSILAMWAPTALRRAERVERAKFLLRTASPGRYNLFGHNCEHAATWCATGFPESHQVRVGLYLNMLRSTGTLLMTAWLARNSRRIPSWIPITTVISFIAVTQYHFHKGRFVREVDRAWRAYKASGA